RSIPNPDCWQCCPCLPCCILPACCFPARQAASSPPEAHGQSLLGPAVPVTVPPHLDRVQTPQAIACGRAGYAIIWRGVEADPPVTGGQRGYRLPPTRQSIRQTGVVSTRLEPVRPVHSEHRRLGAEVGVVADAQRLRLHPSHSQKTYRQHRQGDQHLDQGGTPGTIVKGGKHSTHGQYSSQTLPGILADRFWAI